MPFDFAKAKTLARQTVHSTLGVRAFYQDSSVNPPVEVRARWHNKIDRMGDLDNQSYAELIQGINRVVFSAADARRLNMKRGGIVTFPDYPPPTLQTGPADPGPMAFILQAREPSDGPFTEAWEVSRKEA